MVSRTLGTRQRCTFLIERWWYVDATVRVGWGGVGWGAITFMCLAFKLMLRWGYVHDRLWLCDVLLALAHTHTRHATLGWGGVANNVQVYFHTHVMLRYCAFFLHMHTHTSYYATARSSCTCAHTSCYATARSSCTCTQTSCCATARRSSCTCTHTHRRHATLLHVLLALAHRRHATLGWGGVVWGAG